ncbi:MAG: hypothetical protein LBU65_08880 [Planctomycetaceae bacterium]|jgi:hypothetical protein|nr:hypothetical protein [Planctomycetaceae bacterium]
MYTSDIILIQRILRAIGFRERVSLCARLAAVCLFVVWCVYLTLNFNWFVGLLSLFVEAVVCILILILLPYNIKRCAVAADKRYQLKDRFLTACCLVGKQSLSDFERLQIEDAAKFVHLIRPCEIVPYRLSPFYYAVIVLMLSAGALSFFCTSSNSTAVTNYVTQTPSPEILNQLQHVKELIESLNKNEQKTLTDLYDKLANSLGDPKDALAVFSEMESAIRQKIDELNIEPTDKSLEELGKTFSATKQTQPAGDALQKKNYSQAATALEKADTAKLSPQETQTLAHMLKENAAEMETRNQSELANQTRELAEKLSSGDPESANVSLHSLAKVSREQAARSETVQKLQDQLASLEMYKSEFATASANGKNGGNTTDKSETESKGYGQGISNNDSGKETQLDHTRIAGQLTGMKADGESEVENQSSGEINNATANRNYQTINQEYKKQTEATINSEKIPLSKRRVVRKYFEKIM